AHGLAHDVGRDARREALFLGRGRGAGLAAETRLDDPLVPRCVVARIVHAIAVAGSEREDRARVPRAVPLDIDGVTDRVLRGGDDLGHLADAVVLVGEVETEVVLAPARRGHAVLRAARVRLAAGRGARGDHAEIGR